MKKKLSNKQNFFIKEYLIDFNATQAAIRAGYSKKRADQIGYENLRKPEIQRSIQKQIKKRCDRLEISADRVLKERARIAFFDIRKLFNKNGTLKQVHELDDDTAAAVNSIILDAKIGKNTDGEFVSSSFIKIVKTLNKDKSLEALEKHLGLYEKDNDQKGNLDQEARNQFMEDLFKSISAATGRGLPAPVGKKK